MKSPFLLASYPAHPHSERVDTGAGGNEKCMAVLAAKADISGPIFGDWDLQYLLPHAVKNRDSVAGKVDIPVAVDGHTVGTHFAEEPLVGQGAVFLNIVDEGLAGADIGDIERFAIRRSDNAVRLLHVIGYPY